MSDHEAARRQILYGLLALQNGFLDIEGLVGAMAAWAADKGRSIGEVLAAQGKIDAEAAGLLEALVSRHVARHGGSAGSSLAAVAEHVPARVLDELGDVADPDVEATMIDLGVSRPTATPSMTPTEPWASEGGDPEATTSFAGARRGEAGGRFRKVRLLADDHGAYGHMGVIWVAEDRELHREVALKEIRPRHADDADSRVRFVREAELGGGLEHPGVVPVYSLGAGADRRPHFAMRLIRGESLRQAVRRHYEADRGLDAATRNLEFRGLLRRFIDACNAIAYAHDRGVIHRDIKPANIMLGTYGETLVIDWGLARTIERPEEVAREAGGLLRPPSVSGTDYRDEQGQIIGTPAYMPPEALGGPSAAPGPAGDIYSLGVTLYVILTGRAPFQGPVQVVLEHVRAARFPRPSAAFAAVPKALEAICLKAMSRSPADRYATARELAREIERWLGDEAVEAYRDPLPARAARWARRHQPLVAGVGALLVTGLVALGVGLWRVDLEKQRTADQARRAERGEQVARENANRAEENARIARKVAFDVLALAEHPEEGLNRVPGTGRVRAQMVAVALGPFDTLLAQDPEDPDLRYQAARLRVFRANIHRTLNELDVADAAYAGAVGLLEGLIADAPDEGRYHDRLSEAQRDHAQLLERRGQLAEAAERLQVVLDRIEPLRLRAPDHPPFRRTAGSVMLDLAGVQSRRGRYDEALTLAAPAVELMRGLFAQPNARQSIDPLLLVLALEKQAIALRELERAGEALIVHDEAIALARPRAAAADADNNDRNVFCRAILERARTLARYPDRRAEAEAALAESVAGWALLAEEFTDVPSYRDWLAVARTERGSLRIELGRLGEAGTDLEPAREALDKLVEEFPQFPGYRGDLGATIAAQARLARARGEAAEAVARRFDEALERLDEALERAPEEARYRREADRARADSAAHGR